MDFYDQHITRGPTLQRLGSVLAEMLALSMAVQLHCTCHIVQIITVRKS